MAVELKVPPLGESITEAVVGKWNKKKGESVSMDEPIVVLETDKVTIDVPAPAGGAILEVRFKEGDKVRVGEVLGLIDGAGASASAAPAQAAQAPAAPAQAAQAQAAAPAQQAAAPAATDTRATPTAVNMAAAHNLDLSQIPGSGAGGRAGDGRVLICSSERTSGRALRDVSNPTRTRHPAASASAALRGDPCAR